MLFGEIIANTFAALLAICLVAASIFLFGKPLWPERHARMVIILPVDMKTTSAVKSTQPNLPAYFEVSKALPRPDPP
jgi:hypothetical protein